MSISQRMVFYNSIAALASISICLPLLNFSLNTTRSNYLLLPSRKIVSEWLDGKPNTWTVSQWAEARKSAVYALDLDKENPDIYRLLAYMYAQRGGLANNSELSRIYLASSLSWFKKAMSMRPSNPWAMSAYVRVATLSDSADYDVWRVWILANTAAPFEYGVQSDLMASVVGAAGVVPNGILDSVNRKQNSGDARLRRMVSETIQLGVGR